MVGLGVILLVGLIIGVGLSLDENNLVRYYDNINNLNMTGYDIMTDGIINHTSVNGTIRYFVANAIYEIQNASGTYYVYYE
jgi:hypothetical protein